MKKRILATRLIGIVALSALVLMMLSRSTLVQMTGIREMLFPYGVLVVLLLFTPALLTRGTPLPATMLVLAPVLVVAAYDQSQLDWLRLLKNFNVTDPASPNLARLGLGLATLGGAWTMHVVDTAERLRARALDRGILASEAEAAHRHILHTALKRGALALAATAGLAALALTAHLLRLDTWLLGRAALVAPLAAAALIATAAYLLAKRSAAT